MRLPIRTAALTALAIATLGLSACAGRAGNGAAGSGDPCLDECRARYKDCAYGSQCMMVQECIMEICIPAESDCKVRCTASRPAAAPVTP